jgi:hypothetical protein
MRFKEYAGARSKKVQSFAWFLSCLPSAESNTDESNMAFRKEWERFKLWCYGEGCDLFH